MTRTNILIAALVASALVNGVLGGVLVQRALAPPPVAADFAGRAGPARFNMHAFMTALPEDARPEARRAMHRGFDEMRPLIREAVEARMAARRAMTAEPFDPDAATAALEAAREARGRVERHGESVVLEVVAGLAPDMRARVLSEAYGGRPPFHHHGHHGSPDRF
ncbi:periplasmic heavy metal sensor [Marinicauda salina]|uniref:periplasmic heavy metal sensor n=1 Tax=Marinicauda salina TaxID=2135793 RepID=UPI0013047C84|nr:periplasmic heavy metal sensor [Marinicauda salina]